MDGKATLEKLEDGFQKLQDAKDSKSLLKKYLTKDIFDALKNKKTKMGATLLDCIQSGIENSDSGVGIYAPDPESYAIFAPIFNPIIEDYHKGFKSADRHPETDFGNINSFVDVDLSGKYVVSTRISCNRNLEGYAFTPCLTENNYKEMEGEISAFFKTFEGEFKGKYYPLRDMDSDTQEELIGDHFLFSESDKFLQAANACRYWPTGRGIYHNDTKTFLVCVNKEDHLRIISMQNGGGVKAVVQRLVTALNTFEEKLKFSRDDRLGYLTLCPTNLGTAIHACVHIKLPKLSRDMTVMENTAAKFNLQVRGIDQENTESEEGVYEVSYKMRLGLTEYQAVKEMQDGILELIKMETADF